MSTFFRYLLSFAMQMAWRRAGKGGAIPPMRLPGKGRGPVNLPIIGPWQMMVASWVLQRVWNRYGSQIKTHLSNNTNDIARRASQYIPDPKMAGAGAGTNRTGTVTNSASVPTPVPVPAPRAAPNFNTQVLSSDDADTSNTSPSQAVSNSTLPQGSILGKLRGRS